MYDQSIEMGAFFKENIFVDKTTLKIKFKHDLSEMYLSHEKARPLSFHYAQLKPSFPLIYRVIEERMDI